MNPSEKTPKKPFDEALDQVKTESLSADEVRDAADRVWTNLQAEADALTHAPVGRIAGCDDFRALIPDYLAHQLAPARRTLLEDHLRECVACRKAFWTERAPELERTTPIKARRISPVWKWAAAACLLVAFGFAQYLILDRYVFNGKFEAVAEQIDGRLLVVDGPSLKTVSMGQIVQLDQLVRTGRDSNAILRLSDGSRIEMKDRSELSLDLTSAGPLVRLRRGSVIVQAAKQKEGRRLAVDTDDCRATVKGTVFAVSRSNRGARVSVVEGQVWVQQGGQTKTLGPGQQYSSSPSLQAVSVEQEVSWSRNVDEHLALLREFVTLGQDLASRMANDELRYSSDLLPLVPENTVFYAAFPNVSQSFGEAYDGFKTRMEADPALASWWQRMNQAGDGGLTLDEVISRVRRLGGHLGKEIVVAVAQQESAHTLVLLADVSNPAAARVALEEDVAAINAAAQKQVAVLVDNPAALTATTAPDHLYFYMGQGFLAVSPFAEEIQRLSVASVSGAAPLSSAFGQRLAQTYAQGAGWLFAADLENLIGHARQENPDQVAEKLGLTDFQQLVIEQKSVDGQLQTRAVLGFTGPRRGMSSWLGDSGPMGALDFVSPDAVAVGCFLIKDPALIVDEIFDIAQSSGDGQGFNDATSFLAAQGINLRDDIAGPLGSEVLVAIDGPILPTPAWKIVIEVDDQARLQRTMERLVLLANQEALEKGKPGVTLIPMSSGGMSYYRIVSQIGPEVTYMYWNGYMIVTPGAGLLSQASQYASSGYSLGRAPAFRALFPAESSDYCSGVMYQNFMPLVGMLADYAPENGALSPEQLKTLRETAAKTPPTLIAVYGASDSIIFSSRGMPGLNLLAMAALGDLRHIAETAPQALVK